MFLLNSDLRVFVERKEKTLVVFYRGSAERYKNVVKNLRTSAHSGNNLDIMESSSSEKFDILSQSSGIQSASGCEKSPTRHQKIQKN
jgi:type I site-specific restriction-modification system R (restriction) subunit